MSKYIIKNCPCYNKDYSCQSKDNITGKYCQDITDCLLKRIVNECKWETNIDVECRGDLAERILSELEIEEVND